MRIEKTVFLPEFRDDLTRRQFCELAIRPQSADGDVSFAVERCAVGGWFGEHAHDLEQWFYLVRGRMKMESGGRGPG